MTPLKPILAVLLVSQVVACEQGLGADVARAAQGQTSTAAAAAPTPPRQLTLEFDLPPGFSERTANGGYVITGFRVGFFRRGARNALTIVEASREKIVANGDSARITVQRPELKVADEDVVLRVQSVTAARASAWSQPLPLAGANGLPPDSTVSPRAAAPQVGRGRGSNAPFDIRTYPRLEQAVRNLVPDGNVAEMTKPFRRAEDIALAAVLCRDSNVPFTAVAQAIARNPRLTVPRAIREVRPSWRQGGIVAKARAEARQLLAPANN